MVKGKTNKMKLTLVAKTAPKRSLAQQARARNACRRRASPPRRLAWRARAPTASRWRRQRRASRRCPTAPAHEIRCATRRPVRLSHRATFGARSEIDCERRCVSCRRQHWPITHLLPKTFGRRKEQKAHQLRHNRAQQQKVARRLVRRHDRLRAQR